MSRLRTALPALRREAGWTLVELLVVSVLGIIVLSVGLTLLNIAVRSEPRISERVAHIQEGRALIERLTRELRQSSGVVSATPSQLVFVTFVKHATCGGTTSGTSIQCQVTYSCSSGTCSRTERNADGTGDGAPVQLVTGLSSDSAFSYVPSPSAPEYVGVRLVFPATNQPGDPEDAVTLDDGVNLRNRVE
jgi:Tfp pilus assembly protein PilW